MEQNEKRKGWISTHKLLTENTQTSVTLYVYV